MSKKTQKMKSKVESLFNKDRVGHAGSMNSL